MPESALEFAAAAERAFADLGDVECARSAESDPAVRSTKVDSVLESLGTAELDPRVDLDASCAAAELCRVAGRRVLPYPVASTLVRDSDGSPVALAAKGRARVDHGDLFGRWRIAGIGGETGLGTPAGPALGSKLGPFVTDISLVGPAAPLPLHDVALLLALGAARVLGVVERAVELAVEHVCGREQFGQTLSRFQTVQFTLADASVAVDGLRELCRYTLWRIFVDPGRSLADALTLRLYSLDAARTVLRTCQQLHGAAGFCDEYDICILCRHVQPDLRLPFGAEHTAEEAFDAAVRLGLEGLFPHGGSASHRQ
jgi:hypothetical protein